MLLAVVAIVVSILGAVPYSASRSEGYVLGVFFSAETKSEAGEGIEMARECGQIVGFIGLGVQVVYKVGM